MLKMKILTKNLKEDLTHNLYQQKHSVSGYELGITFTLEGATAPFYIVVQVDEKTYYKYKVGQEVTLVQEIVITEEAPAAAPAVTEPVTPPDCPTA